MTYARDMSAELDYAFLAEYAKLDHGTLTAVGASYTEVHVAELPSQHQLYVAGRVRTHVVDEEPNLAVTLTPPDRGYRLSAIGFLPRDENAIVYADKVGYVFTLSTPITLELPGPYTVEIELDEQPVRELIFTVVHDNDVGAG